jgi:hypothetical protein
MRSFSTERAEFVPFHVLGVRARRSPVRSTSSTATLSTTSKRRPQPCGHSWFRTAAVHGCSTSSSGVELQTLCRRVLRHMPPSAREFLEDSRNAVAARFDDMTGPSAAHLAPGDAQLSGHRPSQEAKCASVWQRVISNPASLMTVSATSTSMPSICVRSTPVMRWSSCPKSNWGYGCRPSAPAPPGARVRVKRRRAIGKPEVCRVGHASKLASRNLANLSISGHFRNGCSPSSFCSCVQYGY